MIGSVGNDSYVIMFTDANLNQVGRVISKGHGGWTAVSNTLRFNAVSSGTVKLPAYPWVIDAAYTPGNRVVVMRNGVVEIAGPVEVPQYRYSKKDDGANGTGIETINFGDDLSLFGMRVIYPNPAQASNAQTAARYVISGVNAEVAMRALVNLNAGPGALTARRIPKISLGALASVGTNVTQSFRFETVLEGLKTISTVGGRLGFRVVQVGDIKPGGSATLEFQVYAPRDLTGKIRISSSFNNLSQVEWERSAPVATVAIVGGQNDGASRVILERSNAVDVASGYGRREVFVNSSGAQNATEMQNDGDAELKDKGSYEKLSFVATDTSFAKYGVTYGLGDIISGEVYRNVVRTDIIGSVQIDETLRDGRTVQPSIGTEELSDYSSAVALQNKILQEVRKLGAN